MSDRDDRLVDAFLDDLGTAPVPEALAGRIARRARDERQASARPFGRWFGLAAAGFGVIALAGLAFAVAGPKPSPSTGVVPSGSALASASPSAESSARITPDPSNLIASLPPSPSSRAGATFTGRLLLADKGGTPLPATVQDHSGRVIAAAPVPSPGTPSSAIEILAGDAPTKVIVAWTGSACDQFALITLGRNGTGLGVQTYEPSGGCRLMAVDRAVELTFSAPIDPTSLVPKLWPGMIQAVWLEPKALWFADTRHGYIAGRGFDPIIPGPAMVLETPDAGQTLNATVIGWGQVTSMSVVIGQDVVERPVVGITCETEVAARDPLCVPGLFRLEANRWVQIRRSVPLGIATRGNTVLVWEQGEVPATESLPYPPRTLWLSRDGGDHWTSVANPCDLLTMEMTGATFDRSNRLVVVCQGGAGTGSARKQLQRAANDAATIWTTMPPLPDAGTGMQIALTPDGYGYAWGARSPLLSTIDGGATWAPEPGGPDGDVRETSAASPFAAGGGAIIVWDPGMQELSVDISNGGSWKGGINWPQ